jgi:transcription factor TFIIIB component B''
MVNGALVLDQESIQVNSHERDAIDEAAMEVVEENMAYRRITSATWSRHKKVEKWDSDETQRFYNALSMFGTDFEIISRLFPARNRRQMRTKFIAEERKYPEKITAALRTRVPVSQYPPTSLPHSL